MKTLASILLGLVLLAGTATGQLQSFDVTLNIADGTSSSSTNLIIGFDGSASDALDGSDVGVPPAPPSGNFDAYINDNNNIDAGVRGFLEERRALDNNPEAFTILCTTSANTSGDECTISWTPSDILGSATIQTTNASGGLNSPIDMTINSSATMAQSAGITGVQPAAALINITPEPVSLPIELTAFQAVITGDEEAMLTWATASEQDNAGFEIQHYAAGQDENTWLTMAFVEGHGTTTEAQSYSYRATALEPGLHRFRLKQVDFGGTFSYSPEVEVRAELPEAFRLYSAFPNPFNPQTTIRFAVREAQEVTMDLFNAVGQRVRTLYQGVAEAGEVQHVRLDATGLPSGVYLVRLNGKDIEAAQRVVLLK